MLTLEVGLLSYELFEVELGNKFKHANTVRIKRTEDGDLWSTVERGPDEIEWKTELKDSELTDFMEFIDAIEDQIVTVTSDVLGVYVGKLALESRRVASAKRAATCDSEVVYEILLRVVTNA